MSPAESVTRADPAVGGEAPPGAIAAAMAQAGAAGAAVAELLDRVQDEGRRLLRSFEDIRSVPTNLHIVASRLEAYGGPVSTLAENYRLMSQDITRRLSVVSGGEGGLVGAAPAAGEDRREAVERLAGLARSAAALGLRCDELKRLMLGLDSIRVLCRVEAGRMQTGAEGLQAIIRTLDRFHREVGGRLDRILDLARQIRLAAEAEARLLS